MAGRRQPAAEAKELQSMTARGAPPRSEACRKNHGDATKTGRANVNAFSAVGRLVLYGKLVGADWVLSMWILAKGFAGWACWLWAWKDVHCGVSASPPGPRRLQRGVCGRADGACPLPWGHRILGCLGGRVVCSWYDAPGWHCYAVPCCGAEWHRMIIRAVRAERRGLSLGRRTCARGRRPRCLHKR